MGTRTSPEFIGSLRSSTSWKGRLYNSNFYDVIMFDVVAPVTLEILGSYFNTSVYSAKPGVSLSIARDMDNDRQLDESEIFATKSLPNDEFTGGKNVSVFNQKLNPGSYFIEYESSVGRLFELFYFSDLKVSGGAPKRRSDFNGDFRDDLIMVNASGGWSGIWTMNGTSPSAWTTLPYASGALPVDAGDFNNDGKDDLIMVNASGGWSGIWTMNGTSPSAWITLPYAGGAQPVGAGDFNNDGKDDLIMVNASGGWSGIWSMNGTSPSGWATLPYASGAMPV